LKAGTIPISSPLLSTISGIDSSDGIDGWSETEEVVPDCGLRTNELVKVGAGGMVPASKGFTVTTTMSLSEADSSPCGLSIILNER
jgi:hypothetical protein